MKLEWLGQVQEPIDSPRWSRMEKLTAASIALGALGLIWTVFRRAQ